MEPDETESNDLIRITVEHNGHTLIYELSSIDLNIRTDHNPVVDVTNKVIGSVRTSSTIEIQGNLINKSLEDL